MPHSHVYKIWTPQASPSVSKFHKYLLWGVRTTIIKLVINQGCFDNVHCHTIIINFKQLVNWSSPCEAMLYLHVVLTCYSLINIHLHYLKYTMSLQIINGFIVNLYTNNVDNNYTCIHTSTSPCCRTQSHRQLPPLIWLQSLKVKRGKNCMLRSLALLLNLRTGTK